MRPRGDALCVSRDHDRRINISNSGESCRPTSSPILLAILLLSGSQRVKVPPLTSRQRPPLRALPRPCTTPVFASCRPTRHHTPSSLPSANASSLSYGYALMLISQSPLCFTQNAISRSIPRIMIRDTFMQLPCFARARPIRH